MWACAIRVELRIPEVRSLKAKRSVLRPHVERLRAMASLSVAEIGRHDSWQRATLGIAAIAPDGGTLESIIGKVRRYFDSQFDIEMVEMAVSYLEDSE